MAQECQSGTPLTCHPDNERSHPADTRLKPLLSPLSAAWVSLLHRWLGVHYVAWAGLLAL